MSIPEHPLAEKRVLIMSPCFFGCENATADAARALGAHTIVVLDEPSNTIWTKAVMCVFPSVVVSQMMEYARSMQDRYGYQGFDEIIVIKGEALTAGVIHLLRESFPNARCIYHNWDSLRNHPHLREVLPQFDACSSFGPEDRASTKGLKYLPLFYVDEYRDLPAELVQYELFTVTSLHLDRYEVTRKVVQACPADARALTYFFFPSLVALMGKKSLESNLVIPPPREINWRSMSRDAMLQSLVCSRAVIDIQHSNQIGLMMRTIEMIGARRKLITTNVLVKSYDSHDKNNIAVVDRASPVIPSDFLSTGYVAARQDIRKKYSIHAWLAVLLELQPLGAYRNGGGQLLSVDDGVPYVILCGH